MPKRKAPKPKKTRVIKQKQKQSIVINIDNKGRKTRTPRIVKVGSSNPSLGTTSIYTYPLQQPIYNADHNSLKTITETLTNAFNPVPAVKSYQPSLNVPQRKRSEFFSLDEVKLPSSPLVPTATFKATTPVKIPQKIPVKNISSNVSVASSTKTAPVRLFKPIPVKPKSAVQEYFSSLPKSEFSTFPREETLSPFSTVDERKGGFKPTPIPTTKQPIPTTKPPRKIITARKPREGELIINPNTGRKIGINSDIAKGLRASGKIK